MTRNRIRAEKRSVANDIACGQNYERASARCRTLMAKKRITAEKPSVANDIARCRNDEHALAR
jgi:hypothetical protein